MGIRSKAAGSGAAGNAVPGGDRRRAAQAGSPGVDVTRLRRSGDAGRRLAEPYPGYFFISEGWAMVAPVMALVSLLLVIDQFSLPLLYAIVPAVFAVVIAALAPLFVRFERKGRRALGLRCVALGVAVVLPMLLFGASMAAWHYTRPDLSGLVLVGALVVVGLVASVVLSGRLVALVSAMTALWFFPAIATGSAGAIVILLLGCGLGAGAAVRQVTIDRAAQAEQREMRRQQMRAEDILSDFEQTGQGWFWETD
ncbi:MAG TPA: hypothetical protein VN222_08460, partial [Novosphingobium sp.]|nr:hypothetical protein [Novosphingobium sp.]